MIEGDAGQADGATRTARAARPTGRRPGWGEVSLLTLAGLLAVFLGLPVVVLVSRSLVDGSLAGAIASPAVIDALGLSLATTAVSLVFTVTFGLPLAFVLARRQLRSAG